MNAEWQPIETAPKDKRILLGFTVKVFTGIYSVAGKWDNDGYATRPKPHWTHDKAEVTGKLRLRANQPTHWMPMPEAPSNVKEST